tara:strand:+ start:1027 stop:1581 length:555 start_codon:yes stop_codon:yes gene_type:complete
MPSSWNKGTLIEKETSTQQTEASLQPTSTTQQTMELTEAKGYDTLFDNYETKSTPFRGTRVSTMTLGQLYDFSQPSNQYGQYVKTRLPPDTIAYQKGLTSTPMGKYQIIGSVLKSVADQMGLPEDTVFNKETQDKMFLFLARDAIKRGKTPKIKRDNLRGIWEGFKHVDNATLDKLIAEVGNAK